MSAVIIDDDPILYPKVRIPDIYCILSQEGFEKYGRNAAPDAIMILDSSLVHDRPACRYVEIPATPEAKKRLGRDIVANIIMLGALVEVTGVIPKQALERAILDSVPKGTEELNLNAMELGFELAGATRT
jgi:2-oxoglutarate ferredoxin oxidoreductase subunit gamma